MSNAKCSISNVEGERKGKYTSPIVYHRRIEFRPSPFIDYFFASSQLL